MVRHIGRRRTWTAVVVAVGLIWCGVARAEDARKTSDGAAFQAAIEADWVAQERRQDRAVDAPQSIRDAAARAEKLLNNLRRMPDGPDVRDEANALERLRQRTGAVEVLDAPARAALYYEIRRCTRALALKNPLLADRPIVFLKRRRFVCQMLHEYIGYYYNYGDLAGGGVYVLLEPGRSMKTRDLIGGRLPRGNYATAAVSHDAATIYFAFAEVRDLQRDHQPLSNWKKLPSAADVPDDLNYYTSGRSSFHVYAMGAAGENLRQLTDGPEDDFDPCPLPDGGVAFMSSRRGGFCRCDNPFEPIPTHTLHRMDASGANVRMLSAHETNEWHPSVLADGRIVYCRWDYVDRSAAHFHGLWVSNPDGSNPSVLFGNYTQRISTCFQPRAIPGSNRIVFVAGAHHANVGGSLAIFDPARVKLDPKTGQDRFDSIEILTPEVCFPEAPNGWPASYFSGPWPLSEDYYLVAFSFDPLPGMGSGELRDTETGIYYFDRFGNLELLYREPGIACTGPMPLAPRRTPTAIPDVSDPALGDEGEFVLADVNWSLLPLPESRPIHTLRIFQILPKESTHIANRPRIGHANAESARMLLGTVPVERDGSAYFRAPAGVPLYFQAVDANGRAVQSMRSVTYLKPGERRGCVGCHERPGTTPPRRPLAALRRPASTIEPGPDGTRPWSYPRLVQPVLQQHCVRCHDGSQGPEKSPLVLTGQPAGSFTTSYESLRPHVRWHEWGGQTITPIVTRPGRQGADESPLSRILEDATHREAVKMSDAGRRRINIWLDGNVPFYGTYRADQQRVQQAGGVPTTPILQ
ncbi:MAG: hypothetical protein HQ567_02550 [Candidatus Nealsonbacteria bacterium]|nr:hypothetical protein [Candidatus Nealsonbacteria bacterium]